MIQAAQQNTAAPAAAPAAPSGEPNSAGIIPSYDERAASAFGDPSSETAADPSAPPAPLEGSTAASGDEAAKRAARRKQLDATLAQMRQSVDAQARHRQAEEAIRRAAAIERENDELKRQVAERVDPSTLTEQGFFDLAKKLQVAPKKLGEWLRLQAESPEVIATQAAQRALDPKLSELEKRLAEQDAYIKRIDADRATEKATAEAYARGASMIAFTEAASAQAPFAAQFLKQHGPEEFITLANSAAASVPMGPGWEQGVLDLVEDNLTLLLKPYLSQQAAAPQQKQAPTPPNPGAAKPMNTVSNTLAQSRASVVDEEADWAALSYDERAARLFGDGR